jgi:thiamine phosphate synthase YjbQ (UPF0047 family)
VDITAEVAECVRAQGLKDGVVTIFIPHTTAGVTTDDNKVQTRSQWVI